MFSFVMKKGLGSHEEQFQYYAGNHSCSITFLQQSRNSANTTFSSWLIISSSAETMRKRESVLVAMGENQRYIQLLERTKLTCQFEGFLQDVDERRSSRAVM